MSPRCSAGADDCATFWLYQAVGLASHSAISMTNATSETGPRAQAKTAGARFLGKFTVPRRYATV